MENADWLNQRLVDEISRQRGKATLKSLKRFVRKLGSEWNNFVEDGSLREHLQHHDSLFRYHYRSSNDDVIWLRGASHVASTREPSQTELATPDKDYVKELRELMAICLGHPVRDGDVVFETRRANGVCKRYEACVTLSGFSTNPPPSFQGNKHFDRMQAEQSAAFWALTALRELACDVRTNTRSTSSGPENAVEPPSNVGYGAGSYDVSKGSESRCAATLADVNSRLNNRSPPPAHVSSKSVYDPTVVGIQVGQGRYADYQHPGTSNHECHVTKKRRKNAPREQPVTMTTPIRDWLLTVDNGTGCLLRYEDALMMEFDGDLVQVAASFMPLDDGQRMIEAVDPHFWEALRVQSVSHKLLFAEGIMKLQNMKTLSPDSI